jgi:hypothetical protein
MNKIIVFSLLLVTFCVSQLVADNLGSVKKLGIYKGNNGQTYMCVSPSVLGGYFGAGGNRIWGAFYIPWNSNDVIAAAEYSSLQKALLNSNITFEANGGFTADYITGSWVCIVTSWSLSN